MIVYGKNTVVQLIKDKKKINRLILSENAKVFEIVNEANKRRIPVEFRSKKEMDRLCEGGIHQGVVAEIEDYKTKSIDEVLAMIPQGKTPLLVMLDGLEDPHNLGAILRTCDAVQADGVIIGKHRSVGLTATVAKVSTGAIDTIPVAQVTNLTQTLKYLKQKGFWICGTDMNDAIDYRQGNYDTPLVLVIGSEGFGVSKLVKSECDYMVSLPMAGKVSSLNASVACGILLYEIYSKRNPI